MTYNYNKRNNDPFRKFEWKLFPDGYKHKRNWWHEVWLLPKKETQCEVDVLRSKRSNVTKLLVDLPRICDWKDGNDGRQYPVETGEPIKKNNFNFPDKPFETVINAALKRKCNSVMIVYSGACWTDVPWGHSKPIPIDASKKCLRKVKHEYIMTIRRLLKANRQGTSDFDEKW